VTVFIDEESEGIESLPCIFRYLLNNRVDIGFFCLHLTHSLPFEVASLKLHLDISDQTLSAAIMNQRVVPVSMCHFNIVKGIK